MVSWRFVWFIYSSVWKFNSRWLSKAEYSTQNCVTSHSNDHATRVRDCQINSKWKVMTCIIVLWGMSISPIGGWILCFALVTSAGWRKMTCIQCSQRMGLRHWAWSSTGKEMSCFVYSHGLWKGISLKKLYSWNYPSKLCKSIKKFYKPQYWKLYNFSKGINGISF